MTDELRMLMIAAIEDKHGEEVGHALLNLYAGIKRAEAQIERLSKALIHIRSVVGTSTEAWHIANDALEGS